MAYVKDKENINAIREEYLQVRNMIDCAIARQDKYLLSIFSLLGVANILQTQTSFYFNIVIMITTLFLIFKVMECRNMVFYNTSYLVVFLESKETNLLYETRFQLMRIIFWKDKRGITNKKIYNFAYKFAYYIKNGIICAFTVLLSMQIILGMWPIQNGKEVIKFIVLIILTILNILYTVVLLNDRFLTKEFLNTWLSVKIQEKSRNT